MQGPVGFNGGRAKLEATTGTSHWNNLASPAVPTFPENELASRLLNQPGTKPAFGLPPDGVLHGDAILVKDIRRHYSLNQRSAEQGEVEYFNEMLSTPRTLIEGRNEDPPQIFFYEEPNEGDLVLLKLRFG